MRGDWRFETAADVGFGNHEAEEWRDASRHTATTTSCQPGSHRMVRDGHRGGVCTHCGETVSADDL